MTNQPPISPDIRTLWRNQPEETLPMSLEDIRRAARRFQSRKRRGNVVEYAAALVGIGAWGFFLYRGVLQGTFLKLGAAYGVAWALYYMWQRHRLMSANRIPEDAAACLDFHRRELERQRDVVRGAWRWMLAPMAPLLLLMFLGRWFEFPAPGRALWLDRAIIGVSCGFVIETLVLMALWLQHRADVFQDRIDELSRLGSVVH